MIIGLVGFIGSGKGTVGEILANRGFKVDSFANPLKDAVSVIFNWPRELLEGDTNESREWREKPDQFWSATFGKEFTPRLALQLMGTEAGRQVFHDDLWVISLMNRSKENVVITDVRFRNEIDCIQKNSGKVIRVVRGEDPFWYRHLYSLKDEQERRNYMQKFNIHLSEWDWVGSRFDCIIYNNGTFEKLNESVDKMLTYFNSL